MITLSVLVFIVLLHDDIRAGKTDLHYGLIYQLRTFHESSNWNLIFFLVLRTGEILSTKLEENRPE